MPKERLSIGYAEMASEIGECWPLMRQLRPHLDSSQALVDQVIRQSAQGYKILVLRLDDEIVALAGLRRQENMIFGDHIYVDDLVTNEKVRGRGYGTKVIEAVEQECAAAGLSTFVLDTALENVDAQRFYERHAMRKKAVKYLKRWTG
jgi:ribosomal protein S18 acetylase RimI-like enzyme